MKNKIINYLFIIIFFLPFSFVAQNEAGNWLMYFGTNKISEKFSIHTEFQYRNHTIASIDTEQLLLRTGLNYHLSNKAIATAGYAYIPSYTFESDQKSPEVEEHRIWQQFILTNKVGKIKFEHRYRLEQRFVNNNYKNRFRYRIMLFLPLNKPTIEKGTLFLGLYDEVFINDRSTFFDRNRLYGGLGYQVHKNLSLQTGVLHQQVNNLGKLYLQFAVIFNTDLRKNINK
ncbi:MAG: DUF2490 domain-containing protein [Flavobacteriaceae bacterium]|nr:DUF2490 domain-containing protein [Flavobacteriaceae bacterium]